MRRVAVYVRLSEWREGDTTTSPQRQEADCRKLAEAKGWDVVELYRDLDVSAWSGRSRPAFERMIADAEAGAFDLVLVWKLDRFSRNLRDFLRTQERLERSGVALASFSDPIDTTTPTGRAMVQLIAVFAELESATISYRVKAASASAAQSGRPHAGGRRAFGFDRDGLTMIAAEAELIREAARRFVAGENLYAISRDWRDRGVVTPYGNAWTSQSLSQLLRSPRLAGYRAHLGAVYDGQHDAILDVDLFTQLQDALAESRRHPGNRERGVHRHLLTRLARCGATVAGEPCGGGLVHRGTRERPMYVCDSGVGRKGCGKVGVTAALAEDRVWELLRAGLLDGGIASQPDTTWRADADDLRAVIDETNDTLATLAVDHYVQRRITRDQFLAAMVPLEQRLADAERQLATDRARATPIQIPRTTEALDAWWAIAGLSDRRALLEQHIDHVTIAPATRPYSTWNPDRIVIAWRD